VTLAAWLREREPVPAAPLRERIAQLAAPFDLAPGAIPERCLASARAALQGLLQEGAASRDRALDLLAIDALVTYAFEAAATTPDRVPELAREAMERLAAVAPVA
jgi:hypothetical protein